METASPSLFARIYLRMSDKSERAGQADRRARLLEGLDGRVLEVGAGHGLNFRHYPSSVTEVVAIEPDPTLRELGRREAERAQVAIQLIDGDAGSLPASDGEFDAAIASLVLCSVPDPDAALGELYRVLRPGGELRFYEHVRSRSTGFARFQRVVDIGWPVVGGGCHTSRDTGGAIERAGFDIESCERFDFRPGILHTPVKPHIFGTARR